MNFTKRKSKPNSNAKGTRFITKDKFAGIFFVLSYKASISSLEVNKNTKKFRTKIPETTADVIKNIQISLIPLYACSM